MAKKAAGKVGRPSVPEPKGPITSLRGSKAFAAWFEGLAKHERDTGAAVIEKALVYYAAARGYKPAPPER